MSRTKDRRRRCCKLGQAVREVEASWDRRGPFAYRINHHILRYVSLASSSAGVPAGIRRAEKYAKAKTLAGGRRQHRRWFRFCSAGVPAGSYERGTWLGL